MQNVIWETTERIRISSFGPISSNFCLKLVTLNSALSVLSETLSVDHYPNPVIVALKDLGM